MKLPSISAGGSVWTVLSFNVSFGLACFAYAASAQLTLLSTAHDRIPGGGFGYARFGTGYAAMTAWTQDRTYSEISVAARLNGSPSNNPYAIGTSTGTFYLMTRVGPGTTTASELARASFSVTASAYDPELLTLFSGLTLGPGTYYLVGSGDGGGWENTADLSVTTAPGIALAVENYQSQIYNSYIPANSFRNWYLSDPPPYNLEFVVSVVPEPTSGMLFGVGSLCLVAVLGVARRPSRA